MKLEEGEVICDKCGGTGTFIEEPTLGNAWKHPWCPKCHGAKKVDWVSNAIWEKENCHYVKPGVYTKEIDFSEYIPSINKLNGFIFGTKNKREIDEN